MRAKEFISEDHQKLDEVAPLVPVIGIAALKALGAAGLGYQAYESWNDYQDYKSGKIDGAELTARLGVDAATALIGGAVVKGGVGVVRGGKAVFDAIRKGAKYKVAQQTAKTADDAVVAATPKPGMTIQPPKATNLKSQKQKGAAIKQDPNAPKGKQDPKTPKGRIGAGIASGGKKVLDKVMGKKGGRIGAGLALGAGDITGADDAVKDMVGGIGDKFSKIVDKINKGTSSAGDVGDGVVYFGKEKNPPMKKVAGVNDPLYTKPNNAVKDSNSPVPTAKDPKLPKQNTTSLSTQQGVK